MPCSGRGRGDEKQDTPLFWISLLSKVFGIAEPEKHSDFEVRVQLDHTGYIDTRALYPDRSLANLYDEVTMPSELRRAHQRNDVAVMDAYGFPKGSPECQSETACLAELMRRYQALCAKSFSPPRKAIAPLFSPSADNRQEVCTMTDLSAIIPEDPTYIHPQRAWNMLKTAHGMMRTVYVSGVIGTGKTSLMAHYLGKRKAEYFTLKQSDLPQDLAQKQENKRIVVVDDLHTVHGALRQRQNHAVLSQLAADPGVWLVMLSRSPLPPWLKPLAIERMLTNISEGELLLSAQEVDAYWAKWNLTLMPETRRLAIEVALGHPLCLRIFAKRMQNLPYQADSEARLETELAMVEQTRRDWWDYLAQKLSADWPVELYEYMRDLSIVETFDLQTARLITKNNNIVQHLQMP